MYNQSKLQLQLIRHLLNAQNPLSSDVLAVVMGTTSKTIRSYIDSINEILKLTCGAKIVSKTGTGYYLEVLDEAEFWNFNQTFNSKYFDDYLLPDVETARIRYMIRRLLFSENYVKIEWLADELFVSRTTVSSALKSVKAVLSEYHLELQQRANYGIRVAGQESHRRVAQSDYIYSDEDSTSLDMDIYRNIYRYDTKVVREQIYKNLIEYNISIANNSLLKLTSLLLVSDYRIRSGCQIEFHDDLEDVTSKVEFLLAKSIVNGLFETQWGEIEIAWLAAFIISRRNITDKDRYEIRKERKYYEISGRIIDWIYSVTEVDLTIDPKFRVELARHLRGMFYRINYGFEKKDVRLLETKGNNSAFEYAVIAARYLELEYGYQVQESEIVYLSYRFFTHFRLNANHGKQNILVVMDKGANTSDLFIYELTLEFGNYIGDFDSAEIYQIPYLPIENFDCLITDIPSLKFDYKIPVLRVNYFLTEKDITFLKDYFTRRSDNALRFLNSFREELFVRNIDAESKEEVIKLLYDKVIDNMELEAGVYENILERERMASTEQGNCTATPHSFYATREDPLIVVGVLKKPIIWDKEKCRLVFLVLNGSVENELFTALSMIKIAVQDIRFVYNMINAKTFGQAKLCISDYMDRIK